MKFGLFILPSWPEAEASHQSRILHEAVEQIQYAEELGFDAVWLAEHHFTRFGVVPSALPFATYVAARTRKIRIGTGVSVLTFHHPVFMAEETAMLDVLSHGRLDFGVGRGQVVYEYNNFKVEYDSRTQRFQEIVDIILGLWRTPGFTYHGTYYQVDDLTIAPVPVQQPHPPMYLAVSRTPASVDVAVSRNLPILTSANTPDEDVLGIRELYHERCAAAGKRPLVEDMPFFRLVHVAEDAKQATSIPRDSLTWVRDLNSLRRTLTGGSEIYSDLEHWRRTRTVEVPSYESELQTTAYFGTPDNLVQRLRWLQETHHVQYFGASMSFGKMKHADVMRSMALFAQEVMPVFREKQSTSANG
jgi:alkanesulfonate monooxygenase SsuD/methylene tetrahydromethanopterin reductase-like flavin-dependent oxidoreductase (luciferase family)